MGERERVGERGGERERERERGERDGEGGEREGGERESSVFSIKIINNYYNIKQYL